MTGCIDLHECPEVGAVCACCFGGECRCLCDYSNCFRPMATPSLEGFDPKACRHCGVA